MLKEMLKGMVIGGAALTIAASSAMADKVEVNLYGASAQFKFWTAAAPVYLSTDYGCDGGVYHAVNELEADGDPNATPPIEPTQDRDAGIAVCNGDTAIPGVAQIDGTGSTDTLVIRYTTNASYDGVYAIQDDNSLSPDTNCTVGGQRLQPVLDGSVLLQPHTAAAGTSIPNLACMDVHIGASDVAAATFGQYSKGNKKGPNQGGPYELSIYDVPDPEPTYTAERPIVVPFGFFANNTPGNAIPFDNITRPMAVNLFTGKIANWNQFGMDQAGNPISSQQVVVCLRHAGSGTHATLDAAILRGDGIMPKTQKDDTDFLVAGGFAPYIWFNKGSSDEIKCVAQNAGGIGYADVDKCGSKCNGGEGSYGYAKLLTYNGVEGKADTIKNGQYDFWAAQWLYYDHNATNAADVEALINWASVGANMPASKALYWAAQNDMKFAKSSDFALPIKK